MPSENETLFTMQLSILWYAVRSLIETHERPKLARAAFDREYDRARANLVARGAPPEAFQYAQGFVESLWGAGTEWPST